jgi:hypothetical protein
LLALIDIFTALSLANPVLSISSFSIAMWSWLS